MGNIFGTAWRSCALWVTAATIVFWCEARGELIINVYQDGAETVVEWGDGAGGPGNLSSLTPTGTTPPGISTSRWNKNGSFDRVGYVDGGFEFFDGINVHGSSSFISASVDLDDWTGSGDSLQILNRSSTTGNDAIYTTDFDSIKGELRRTGLVTELNFVPTTISISGSSESIQFVSGSPTPSAIPEPATSLALVGLVTSAFFRRRRRLLPGLGKQ